MKIIMKENRADDYRRDMENLYDEFRAKDYFYDDQIIEMKIEQWEKFGKPEPYTPEMIRTEMNKMFKEKGMKWLMGCVEKILEKDLEWMTGNIRHDQKVMKRVFEIVTGINIKSLSDKALKPVLMDYANS